MEMRVEYIGVGLGKKFDVKHNLNKFWGVNFDELIGLVLVDRIDPNQTAKISSVENEFGMAIVYWENGGWNCLDHAIEQFDVYKML